MGSANEVRDTPGRLLLAWAVLLSSLVLLSWRIHINHADYDWLEYPTALGDHRYYEPGPTAEAEDLPRFGPLLKLGENDFFDPNLRFEVDGEAHALYRRIHQPTPRKDALMRKVAIDATGRFYVYTDAKSDPEKGPRYYLKTAEDAYIEFGEKHFFPTFEETRETPAVQEG